jgi:hypothetical protein
MEYGVMQVSSVSTASTTTYTSSSKTGSKTASTASTTSSGTTDTVTLSSDDLETQYEKLSSKSYLTTAEQTLANKLNDEVNAKEYKAFGHYADEAFAATTKQQDDSLMAQCYKAYVAYYDSLSSTEQASNRYAGTREGAVAAYESLSAEASKLANGSSSSSSSTSSSDPAVTLLKDFEEKLKEIAKQNEDDTASTDTSDTSQTSDTSDTSQTTDTASTATTDAIGSSGATVTLLDTTLAPDADSSSTNTDATDRTVRLSDDIQTQNDNRVLSALQTYMDNVAVPSSGLGSRNDMVA